MYKRMYFVLFNAITDAWNCENKEKADEILRSAQIEAEEICISSTEEI